MLIYRALHSSSGLLGPLYIRHTLAQLHSITNSLVLFNYNSIIKDLEDKFKLEGDQ
jgi:hypothetical protein